MPSYPNNSNNSWNDAIRAHCLPYFLPSLYASPRFTVRVESGFGHCGTNRHTLHFANKITNERQLPSKMSVVAIMSQDLQVHGQLQEKKTHVYRRFWFSKLKIACVFLLMVLVWSDFLGGMHAVCGNGRENVSIMALPWIITNGWQISGMRMIWCYMPVPCQLWWRWLRPCHGNYIKLDYN